MVKFAIVLAALVLLAGTALAQAPAPHMAGMPDGADAAMMAGMDTMNHDMRAAPMTGDTDHDFVAMMIPHHQGAIDMAEVELRSGRDPRLLKFARRIVAAQEREIRVMQAWQAAHKAP